MKEKKLSEREVMDFTRYMFSLAMQVGKTFDESVAIIKDAARMSVGDMLTDSMYDQVVNEMSQKYNKTYKEVHLNSAYVDGFVLIQFVGEYGYVIEESVVNLGRNPSAFLSRKKLEVSLNKLNKQFGTSYTINDINCVKFVK